MRRPLDGGIVVLQSRNEKAHGLVEGEFDGRTFEKRNVIPQPSMIGSELHETQRRVLVSIVRLDEQNAAAHTLPPSSLCMILISASL